MIRNKPLKVVVSFLLIIAVIFGALAWVTNAKNEQKASGNPYNKGLHPATIQQLENPLYENIILPDELNERLENEENVTVYFQNPTCPACKEATPILIPLADSLGIDLVNFNLLEFEHGWGDFKINGTPTIVHYENGIEVNRIEGLQEEDGYKQWYEQISR
ncbi:thioredoxin family protein [Desertibacillus haloalkaliphilus]|uniref:thioredoxin family protein n=1 Tax=Desertibacillus haloalkaliphilus TaxID=1328930 RepID=UPI001C2642DA|nr:thioredoxin family protein [Desertibacillus haloalkaliphilus]MBU8908107.1 thioredoxin family protein [Desertibacillus haloalkaliphilus]